MKKSSNKNFSGKNYKHNKNNHNSNFYSKYSKTSKSNNNYINDSSIDKSANKQNQRAKNDSNSSYLQKRKTLTKSDINFSKHNPDTYQESIKKRSFDDWIWGKHSVFEALNSERSINRIWCTSEIFSSEKFYILLKELKSKGVLIEEVSWNRLSQLTFGASHQGVVLQLASSKTISLEKLINDSKKNSVNPIIRHRS